jgi:hypothetical protein
MERLANIIYYYIYRADYRLHLIFSKINPFMLLHELPFQKRLYERKGINIRNEINEAFRRPDMGLSSIRAYYVLAILSLCIAGGLINVFFGLIRVSVISILKLHHFIIFIIAGWVVCYFLFERHGKYLAYFKEFEKMSNEDKKKWAWLSSVIIIGILVFFIGSILFQLYRLKSV